VVPARGDGSHEGDEALERRNTEREVTRPRRPATSTAEAPQNEHDPQQEKNGSQARPSTNNRKKKRASQ